MRGIEKMVDTDFDKMSDEEKEQYVKNMTDELGIRGAERLTKAARARGMPTRGLLRFAKRALGRGHLQQVLRAPLVPPGQSLPPRRAR